MNVLSIAVLAIIIGCMIWGYWRGFIRIIFSLVSMILVIVLVSWATPYLTDFLKENTNIYESLTEKCSQQIQLAAENAIENKEENVQDSAAADTEGIKLPKQWVEGILEKAGGAVGDMAEESGLYLQAGEYLADWALRGIAFFGAFLLVSVIVRLVVGLLDIVAKLPLIKGVNRFFGGVLGLVQGLLIVWLLLFLVAIACTSQLGQTMIGYIKDSSFLSYLYDHNGILYLFHYIF